jgi:hypothetical protein
MRETTLFRARVPTARLRRAEEVFARLGIKPGDAFNMLRRQKRVRACAQYENIAELRFHCYPADAACSGRGFLLNRRQIGGTITASAAMRRMVAEIGEVMKIERSP